MEFKFPDTGEGVTEGKFLQWMIDEGDEIEEDQVVGEAETDKAVVDIPAPTSGKVTELKVEAGDTVKVGDVIMIVDDGEEVSEETEEQEEPEEKVSEKVESEPEKPEKEIRSVESSEDVLALPKVRKLAQKKGVDLASIKTGERITEEEVLEAAEGSKQSQTSSSDSETVTNTSESIKATPSVRKLAREEGISLEEVTGSGRDGKITRDDVLSASSSGSQDRETEHRVSETGEEERVEMSGIRKAVADKMERSRFTAPHVTHVDKADVTQLVDLREREKENFEAHLTYMPFIMKAVLEGLEKYPELNAELDEENNEILLKKDYNFNIAVDTEKGLMVPVVDKVDNKSIVELAESITAAVGRAQETNVSKKEMDSGTFSITNLGVIGGEEFTPIINYPQTAILGVGSIKETAEVFEGEVVPRKTVKLSLSYDHRVVDGATAARFMNTVIENLENPEELLMRL